VCITSMPPREDFVEGAAELRVVVVQEEPQRVLIAEFHGAVARLPCDPASLSRCCESAAAAGALAVVSGEADDAAALAPPSGCSPLDVRRSDGSSDDRR
jgi:hypothetical protein